MSQDKQHSVNWISSTLPLLNYISAASLYLKDNYLFQKPLTQDHIKERILGHWGSVPGLSLVYLALSQSIKHNWNNGSDTLLIIGPGHGAPAILAGSWLDDALAPIYHGKYARNAEGMSQLIHDFSWPGGFQSHVTPHIPGSLHEGGELGYSLGISYGTVLDNPNLITYCIVGDGETETGALAASWHSNKFINPAKDGAVLPILHLNGYKISGPTVLSSYTHEELTKLFEGYGYKPLIVDQYQSDNVIEDLLNALETAHSIIHDIKTTSQNAKPLWPMIILKSKKGWTGPKELLGHPIEDNYLSHGIPLKKPKTDNVEFEILKHWLESYHVADLFDSNGILDPFIAEELPLQSQRLSFSPAANTLPQTLQLPPLIAFDNESEGRGSDSGNVLLTCSDFLASMATDNPNSFKVFSPDEAESNRLESLMKATSRQYEWPVREHDEYIAKQGQILEILSEQTLQSWYQGYVLTGRHGIFISYESFFAIISSQIDQYIKFRKTMDELPWRNPQKGMTYLATSTLWRQEHNGYTHQNPSLINSLLAKQTDRINLYFPIGANTLLATLHSAYSNDAYVNYITAGKTDFPQWLTLAESMSAVDNGATVWDWCSDADPDIVFVSIGDYQHHETMAAMEWLKDELPDIHIRLVNVQRITPSGIPGLTYETDVISKLTSYKPIVVNFHGYPEAIKQLFFNSPASGRMTILGYHEKGGTTTPFNMQVLNEASRFHMALFAAQKMESTGVITTEEYDRIEQKIETILQKHQDYIFEHGDDMPEIKNWKPKLSK